MEYPVPDLFLHDFGLLYAIPIELYTIQTNRHESCI